MVLDLQWTDTVEVYFAHTAGATIGDFSIPPSTHLRSGVKELLIMNTNGNRRVQVAYHNAKCDAPKAIGWVLTGAAVRTDFLSWQAGVVRVTRMNEVICKF